MDGHVGSLTCPFCLSLFFPGVGSLTSQYVAVLQFVLEWFQFTEMPAYLYV